MLHIDAYFEMFYLCGAMYGNATSRGCKSREKIGNL